MMQERFLHFGKWIEKLWKGFNEILALLAGFVSLACMLMIAYNVVMRYIFRSPIKGVVELTQYAMVYICFLSIGWVLQIKGHVGVDILAKYLHGKALKIQTTAIDILSQCYCLPMTLLAWNEAWDSLKRGAMFTGELGNIPEFPVVVVIPIGFAAISLESLRQLVNDVITPSEKMEAPF
jgi:TRAP-type C4-dicarboxylate transport system permease small subunit